MCPAVLQRASYTQLLMLMATSFFLVGRGRVQGWLITTSMRWARPSSRLFSMEWTQEQDEYLQKEQQSSSSSSVLDLAVTLGRGPLSIHGRLQALNLPNPNTVSQQATDQSENNNNNKLMPFSQVYQRIQYDPRLSIQDFSILHTDRKDHQIVETPMNASNDSIAGKATSFVEALPEHRIVGVKYKERIVWDRRQRLDLVFGQQLGIYEVMETYDAWKATNDQLQRWRRERQEYVVDRLTSILGKDGYQGLQDKIKAFQEECGDRAEIPTSMAESFLNTALQLFREATPSGNNDKEDSKDDDSRPSDEELCDLIFEMTIMAESTASQGMLCSLYTAIQTQNGIIHENASHALPELKEEDLQESFVKGSGPGGQKVNKSSNKVVLLHLPTNLRVECQETRSLSQNRNIARKWLRLKLDEFYNGSVSRTSQKQKKAASKKQKNKAKQKKRQKKKAS